VPLVSTGNRTHITVIAVVNAVGVAFDPTFLVPGVRIRQKFDLSMYQDGHQIPTGNGWINESAFIQWVEIFVRITKDFRGNLWSVLLLDGHHTHTNSLPALEILNENRILAICMPSHTTSCLQPLDVSVFGPLKNGFQKSLQEWKIKYSAKVTIDHLPQILASSWDSAASRSNVRAGFKKTGVWPLNLSWVNENAEMIRALNPSKTSVFEALLQKARRVAGGDVRLVKSLDYLDVASKKDVQNQTQSNSLNFALDEIFCRVVSQKEQASSSSARKSQTNKLGEKAVEARILNLMDRLEALHQNKSKERKKEEEKSKINKSKRHEDNDDDFQDNSR
jgi:hypothetical protein